MSSLCVTILAGGLGKRMNSTKPKVLHKIRNEIMIIRLIKEVMRLNPTKILIVVGKYGPQIKSKIEKYINNSVIKYVHQKYPSGTGNAIRCTLPFIYPCQNNIILNGDVPLLQYQTINEIYLSFLNSNLDTMITGINLNNPYGNGRIVMENGSIQAIIEEKDCLPHEKLIKLVNCGIYIAKNYILQKCIPEITNNNLQNEYYITDLVKIYKSMFTPNCQKIGVYVLSNEKEYEIYNVNTAEQLDFINNI